MHRVIALAEIRRGHPPIATPRLVRAAHEIAPLDPVNALEMLLDAAWAANEAADREAQVEIYRLAEELGPSVGGDRTAFIVAFLRGLAAIAEGDQAGAVPFLETAVAFGEVADDPREVIWSASACLWLGDGRRAGLLFERGAALARESGALGLLAPALGTLGLQHFFAQRLDQAAIAGREALAFAREVGADNLAVLPQFVLAGIAAIQGDDEEATRLAYEAIEHSETHGLALGAARPVWALALLDLGRGRWAEAEARLEVLVPERFAMASGLVMQTYADRIEAAVRAGHAESARSALAELEAWDASHAAASSLHARVFACRALLTEGDEATRHFEAALAVGPDLRPFDHARIQLLYGEHLRRERRRTDARVQLRSALEAFERMRAEPWAERTRIELRASGETARKRDPSTSTQLTPQEVQIARLVAEGLSNKEVAAQLFLSPRTIDAHLRNIFGKLAISSRTQLARLSFAEGRVPASA